MALDQAISPPVFWKWSLFSTGIIFSKECQRSLGLRSLLMATKKAGRHQFFARAPAAGLVRIVGKSRKRSLVPLFLELSHGPHDR